MKNEIEQQVITEGVKPQWFSHTMVCGTVRHQLWIGESKTPWFIDVAKTRAHFTQGQKVGVFGSGMSAPNRLGQRIAACFGAFNSLKEAKKLAQTLQK